jgi:hypothetical protein
MLLLGMIKLFHYDDKSYFQIYSTSCVAIVFVDYASNLRPKILKKFSYDAKYPVLDLFYETFHAGNLY